MEVVQRSESCLQGADAGFERDVPDADGAVALGSIEFCAVGGKYQCPDLGLAFLPKGPFRSAALRMPKVNRTAGSSGGQKGSVRGIRSGLDCRAAF